MRVAEVVALFIMLVAIAIPIALLYLDDVFMPEKNTNTIVIRAYMPEAGGFQPDIIRVKKGERVRLVVESMDVTHGFRAGWLGIDLGIIDAGEKKTVEFVADREGIYIFRCTIVCSPYHFFMRGIIIVER
jgi:heme/copper-type cytochrome/quinol oxidase subunit 2